MGSIIRVESCHDLPVQDSGVGVKFCEFVGNTLVCWYICVTKLAYIHIIIGPLLEGEWPIYGKVVQFNLAPINYGDCSKHLEIMKGNHANLHSNHANWFASFKIMMSI